MRIQIMLSLLILFLGLSSLTKAENKENNGYLVSDTPVKVYYIICSERNFKECNKHKRKIELTIDIALKPYPIPDIPEDGAVRIIRLTAGDDNSRNYIYPDDAACLLYNNEAIKFEAYNNIIICRSERPVVAVAQ